MFAPMISSLLFSVLSVKALSTPQLPTVVSQTPISHVAFTSIIDDALVVSTFDANPFGGKDDMFYIQDAKSLLKTSPAVTPKKIGGSVIWPNTFTKVPSDLFGGKQGLLISGGFLVPGKSNGGLWFTERTNGEYDSYVQIFGASGFFYHQAEFYDVNQDGLMDIITCRASKSMFGSGSGDLTWLEPVDRSKPLGQWKEMVIGKGCDTFFKLEDVNGDGVIDIISAEFWGSKLTLIQGPGGKFDDSSKLVITTIDKSIGQVFDVSFVDLNGDGKKEILATNHDGKGKGGVYAYEVPTDIKETWVRHDLTVGIEVLQSGIGQGSPGTAQAFFPNNQVGGKPSIVVAGDASQKAYILTADDPSSTSWKYTRTVLYDCKCTVGGITVADVNKDGKTEFFIPCFDKGVLITLSY